MEKSVEIAVIVVNYGTAALAQAAVDSVLAHDHGGRRVEVHLVDNASPGDDREVLARAARSEAWRDRVIFYPEETNHGFAAGNNLVFRRLAERAAPPDKVFLLNPDAQLENEAISILAECFDRDPGLGFAGAGISEPGVGPAVAAFRFPGLLSEVMPILGLGKLYRLFGRAQVALPPHHPEGEVDWVSGAALMARFSALRELGFFDPAFFLYFEEVDLMRRARVAGWSTRYVPRARILHFEGVATGFKSAVPERRRRPGYWYRSWAHYFQNAHGRPGALLIAGAVLLGAGLHYPAAFLRRRPPTLPLCFVSDFWRHAVRLLLLGEKADPSRERPARAVAGKGRA